MRPRTRVRAQARRDRVRQVQQRSAQGHRVGGVRARRCARGPRSWPPPDRRARAGRRPPGRAAWRSCPWVPRRRSSRAGSRAASSPMVWTPRRASASSIFGPTPQSRRTGSGASSAASPPGGTTTSPSGLRRSDATLATSLEGATPDGRREAGLRVTIASFSARRDLFADAQRPPAGRDVEERLVDGDRLHAVREPAQDLHHLAGDAGVFRHVGRDVARRAGRRATPGRSASRSARRSGAPRRTRWPPRRARGPPGGRRPR